MGSRLAPGANASVIQGIWLYRMVLTPHPLRERMTLFWHDHFATSLNKVGNAALMQRQNDLLRSQAIGDFKAMLAAIGKDPAMLIWLDSTSNKKAKPNENYAREVMELFALGRGRYSEKDIQEAARAFTGWFVIRDCWSEIPSQHDDGPKTVLGKTGRFRGEDIPAILLEQEACAEFLCEKLFRLFVSEVDPAPPTLVKALAKRFRESGYAIRVPVETILRSNLFHDASVRRRRVKSPVEYAVGTVRALEATKPTVSAPALAEACSRMGQGLYTPPSVAGWDGGPSWINTTAMLHRTNFILALLGKDDESLGGRIDPAALAERHGVAPLEFYRDLLVQDALAPAALPTKTDARELAVLVAASPEYQLA
jgi:uncharacterized protein (DUF1800 family)